MSASPLTQYFPGGDLTLVIATVGLVAFSVLVGKLARPIIIQAMSWLTSRTKSTLDDRVFIEIRGPVESFLSLFIFFALIHLIPFYENAVPTVEKYTASASIIVGTYMLFKAAKALFHWYYEEGHKSSKVNVELSLMPLLQKVTQIAILLLGAIALFSELGYQITGLLAITSVIGVIIGLASQETLANLFAGLALQFDRAYHYGEYLRLPTGEMVRLRKIGMRSTKLFDQTGKIVVVSNSEFAKLRITKIGSPSNLVISVAFEAPLNLDAGTIEEIIKKEMAESESVVHDMEKINVQRNKIKAPGWYEGTVKIPVKEVNDYSGLIDKVNAHIIREIERTDKKY
jgi:small-conductance mechanosensitive channel